MNSEEGKMKKTTLNKDHLERWFPVGKYREMSPQRLMMAMQDQVVAFDSFQKIYQPLASTYIYMASTMLSSERYLAEIGEKKLSKKVGRMKKQMYKYIEELDRNTREYVEGKIELESRRRKSSIATMRVLFYRNMVVHFKQGVIVV